MNKPLIALFALAAMVALCATSPLHADDTTESLAAEVAELRLQYNALTNMVKFIEKKCETDESWRKAYHQGVSAKSIQTNEYGVVYSLTIYKDGYVHADYAKIVKVDDPESKAKTEAEQKALIESKREEALAAMEKAQLPDKIAKILADRRAAKKPIEKTVVIDANKPVVTKEPTPSTL